MCWIRYTAGTGLRASLVSSQFSPPPSVGRGKCSPLLNSPRRHRSLPPEGEILARFFHNYEWEKSRKAASFHHSAIWLSRLYLAPFLYQLATLVFKGRRRLCGPMLDYSSYESECTLVKDFRSGYLEVLEGPAFPAIYIFFLSPPVLVPFSSSSPPQMEREELTARNSCCTPCLTARLTLCNGPICPTILFLPYAVDPEKWLVIT